MYQNCEVDTNDKYCYKDGFLDSFGENVTLDMPEGTKEVCEKHQSPQPRVEPCTSKNYVVVFSDGSCVPEILVSRLYDL